MRFVFANQNTLQTSHSDLHLLVLYSTVSRCISYPDERKSSYMEANIRICTWYPDEPIIRIRVHLSVYTYFLAHVVDPMMSESTNGTYIRIDKCRCIVFTVRERVKNLVEVYIYIYIYISDTIETHALLLSMRFQTRIYIYIYIYIFTSDATVVTWRIHRSSCGMNMHIHTTTIPVWIYTTMVFYRYRLYTLVLLYIYYSSISLCLVVGDSKMFVWLWAHDSSSRQWSNRYAWPENPIRRYIYI